MLKCKFRCLHFMIDKLFKMDNSFGNVEKCSCDESDLVENYFCEASSSKDKRSKINLFGLCRDKPLPFSTKRNKKSVASSASSNNKSIVKKSPKWGIKFNCTKKDSKTAFNSANQNCCRCTCYKHKNDEALPGQSNTEFTSDNERLSDQASTSKSSNENEMEVGENNLNHLDESCNTRGVYSVVPSSLQVNNVPNLIVTSPFNNIHW